MCPMMKRSMMDLMLNDAVAAQKKFGRRAGNGFDGGSAKAKKASMGKRPVRSRLPAMCFD
jgi:hypothetical protein